MAICGDPSNLRFVTVRRGAVSTAAALIVGGASLGCSGGAEKAVALPSLSSTPTPTVPAFPKTREGAAAFVRALFSFMNMSLADGNTARLINLRQPSCKSCTRFEDLIRTTYDQSQRIVGGELLVRSSVSRPLEGDRATVTAIVDESAERILGADGHTVRSFVAANGVDNEVALAWTSTSWQVTEVTIFKGGN
jgi:hypothetical protein